MNRRRDLALLIRQHRKTAAAGTTATWWEDECKKHLDAAIGNRYLAEAETKRADRMTSLANKMETRALTAIGKWGDSDSRSLPACPAPVADQSIPTTPWPSRKPFPVEPDGVLALGTVTPIERAVRKS